METFDGLTDEQLADGIATWAGRVAAGEAKLLALIGEFDRREAWAGPGFVSCAHWLSWRIGIGTRAAQERVHAARALRELPQTAAMFADGRLSWSQVRAITRVATAADEDSYLNIARHASGAALERIVRGVRRARKPAEDAADPELAAYRMQVRIRYDENGTMVTTIRSTAQDGALIKAALEAAREQIDHERRTALAALEAAAALPTADVSDEQCSAEHSPAQDRPSAGAATAATDGTECSAEHSRPPGGGPEPAPTDARPARATLGEAMVRVAEAAIGVLDAGRPDAARRRRGRLAVQIDPLSGWARTADGEFLPPGTVRTDDHALPVALRRITVTDLTSADLGRTQRIVSPPLRRLLSAIDSECCRFPGCTRTASLDGHHVIYWSLGGRTDLANLILLCEHHHTVVHAQGFQLTLRADRSLEVRTADGTRLFHHPTVQPQHAEQLDAGVAIGPATLPPSVTDPTIDLAYIVGVLLQHAA